MLTASEIPNHFAVCRAELNSCTFEWKPYLLWFDFLSQRRITTVPNYVLSLVNCCCHSSPHATIVSCGFARFLVFPLLHMHACQTQQSGFVATKKIKRRGGEREGLCTHRLTQKFVCVAARLPLSSWNYFWWCLHIVSAGRDAAGIFFFPLQFEKQDPALITDCVSV